MKSLIFFGGFIEYLFQHFIEYGRYREEILGVN
jgi:hypothetical protein